MSDLRVPDLNKTLIAGRLTRDPEVKYIASGRAVCTLNIANNRYYRDKAGERKEKICFIEAVLWDKQAEWSGENLHKGNAVLVEGSLEMDCWTDKETGKERTKLKIGAQRVTPLEWQDGEETRAEHGHDRVQRTQRSERNRPSREIEEPIPEDDIPF